MFAVLLLTIATALIAYIFFKWITLNNDYFKRRGIKSLKPVFLVGNADLLIYRNLSAVELGNEFYYYFPDDP